MTIWRSGVAGLGRLTVRLSAQGSKYARLLAVGTVLGALPRISLLDLSHLAVAVPRLKPLPRGIPRKPDGETP